MNIRAGPVVAETAIIAVVKNTHGYPSLTGIFLVITLA